MLDTKSKDIQFTMDAVRQASLLVKMVASEMVSSAITKDDRSPVTVADFAAQALVGKLLMETFPGDPLVGEEDSAALQTPEEAETLVRVADFVGRFTEDANTETVCTWIDHGAGESAQRFWTLDPIDGTKGFLRGDQYAVAFALIEDGQVQVGALGCPNLTGGHQPDHGGSGSLVVAARGQGTWVTSLDDPTELQPLSVSAQLDPAGTRLLRSFESGHTDVSMIDVFADAMGAAAEPVRMDSQAKYAVLAAGHGEVYLRLLSPSRQDYREKIWDQAAGSIVIEEAGGKVTDLHGKPLDFSAGRTLANNRGICATNGHLHPAAIKALAEIGA